MTPALELRFFGSPAAWVDGNPLPPLRSRKGLWLLALLALRPHRPLGREWLAETLWPDSAPGQAFYNLRQCLTNLRCALGASANCVLAPTRHTLCLDMSCVWTDVTVFDAGVTEGSLTGLEHAIVLYRGPLLEGCMEEWSHLERTIREQQYLDALSRLAQAALSRQQPACSVPYLRLLIAADPLRESAHCTLMQALAECGDYAAVTQIYRDLRLHLHQELHAVPAPETEALYVRLQRMAKQSPRSAKAGTDHATLPPRHLPVPLTRLIGREREIKEIVDRLQTARLVTLTGAGGVGKTRLSLAVGEAFVMMCPGGVWFVELAALSDSDHVLLTVAQTLGLREQSPAALLTAVIATINTGLLLLILDNCEHLLAGCTPLAQALLSACPNLRVLTSSRQPMGAMGEQIYRVPSLALPPPAWNERDKDFPGDAAALAHYPGIQLFVERASQWQPNFRVTPGNVGIIVDIARHLDGIPLAIELAASQLRSLSITEVQERLQNRFDLLVSHKSALPRHRTLQALIDWSYNLLDTREQRLLRRLSVFAGGWTLDAAQFLDVEEFEQENPRLEPPSSATFAADGDETSQNASSLRSAMQFSREDLPTLELLTSLVDKSLIVADTQHFPARFRMLETVRQYLEARLRENGEYAAVRRRHCHFFLGLAEEVQQTAHQSAHTQGLACLEREYDNIRAALAWCRHNSQENETEFRLSIALYTFWYLRGPLCEARECLLRAAAYAASTQQTAWQGRILLYVGALARMQGDLAAAQSALEQGLPFAQLAADTEVEAGILTLLGSLSLSAGETAVGLPLLEQALCVARRGRHRHSESECLVWLGDAARWRGNYDAARAFYEEGLVIGRTLNFGWFAASARGMLGELALLRGEVNEAQCLVHSSLRGFQEVGDRTSCAFVLCTAAGIAAAKGALERAACLLAMVSGLLQTHQMPLPGPDHELYQCRLRDVKAALGIRAFALAYETGCKADWEQIVTFVLEADFSSLFSSLPEQTPSESTGA